MLKDLEQVVKHSMEVLLMIKLQELEAVVVVVFVVRSLAEKKIGTLDVFSGRFNRKKRA